MESKKDSSASVEPTQVETTESTKGEAAESPRQEITYEIIAAPENTFGYKIFMDRKAVINQPHIPGVPGVTGFKSKEDAIKVAEIVIGKMNRGEMPPTISPDELKEAGVLP